jgi:hypothetical protein
VADDGAVGVLVLEMMTGEATMLSQNNWNPALP